MPLEEWEQAAAKAWGLPEGARKRIADYMGLQGASATRLDNIMGRIAEYQRELSNSEENPGPPAGIDKKGSVGYKIYKSLLANEEEELRNLRHKKGSDQYDFFWKYPPGKPPPPPPPSGGGAGQAAFV
jgi:hypothetical protein